MDNTQIADISLIPDQEYKDLRRILKNKIPGIVDKKYFNKIWKAYTYIKDYEVKDRVERIFYKGSKKRKIYEPKKDFIPYLKAFNKVLNAIFWPYTKNITITDNTSTFIYSNEIKSSIEHLKINSDSGFAYKVDEKSVIVKLDIYKAFDSTDQLTALANIIKALPRSFKNLSVVNTVINKLHTLFVDNQLPQGFNTSSTIFNIISNNIITNIIKKLNKLKENKNNNKYCKKCYAQYTNSEIKLSKIIRYVDDFVIFLRIDKSLDLPCKTHYNYIYHLINRCCKNNSYRINNKKFIIYHEDNKRYIKFLGYSIAGHNIKRIAIKRKTRKRLDSIILSYNKDKNFLNGIIGYKKSI